MEAIVCKACGAGGLQIRNGRGVCEYCGTVFILEDQEKQALRKTAAPAGNGIALESDIDRLLRKCAEEPRNAARYASLILDMDPDNEEALKYLRRR